jgi:hypothetical protein
MRLSCFGTMSRRVSQGFRRMLKLKRFARP